MRAAHTKRKAHRYRTKMSKLDIVMDEKAE